MNEFFVTSAVRAVAIHPILKSEFSGWLEKQNAKLRNWLTVNNFKATSGEVCLAPDREGMVKQVFLGINDCDDVWAFGALPNKLPEGVYQIKGRWKAKQLEQFAIMWALGAYKFTEYKSGFISKAKLLLPENININQLNTVISSTYLARDLINFPAENMGPLSLSKALTSVAIEYGAKVNQVIGEDLVKAGYNAIYAVGKGSSSQPRLLDLTWGKEKNPSIVLVGKGVCFDSGGLDIKPASGMAMMKRDMAGAAYAIALAKMIMAAELPVHLRVLIPAVENMVSGNSYKPGDVIKTHKGITVENTNTDAEGRLILADALAVACEANPDLVLDFASLTGAARVALGAEITAMFTAEHDIAHKIMRTADEEHDPIWQLPMYARYRDALDSDIADIKNAADTPWGGAITAALFLREFVEKDIPWVHFDVACFNEKVKPGRPKGADVSGLRAIFDFLVAKFS